MEEGTGQARLQGEQLRPAPVLLAFLGVLTALHVVYLSLSTAPPSWDEAHYMSGAIGIERGLRSGTLRGAWDGYVTALGFKPPLIAVPAAFLMLVLGEGIFPSMVSLALIFMAIGIATWSLVRNILPPAQAALATALLCTAPMVTGLTHRFFVEGLLLLIAVAYLDALLRHPWDRIGWAAVAGALLGLGALTKLTFLALLFPSTVYLLFARARIVLRDGPKGRALALLGARACLMLLVAFAIAWPWYSRNWRGTVEHSRTFFWAESCAYPALDCHDGLGEQGDPLVRHLAARARGPRSVRLSGPGPPSRAGPHQGRTGERAHAPPRRSQFLWNLAGAESGDRRSENRR